MIAVFAKFLDDRTVRLYWSQRLTAAQQEAVGDVLDALPYVDAVTYGRYTTSITVAAHLETIYSFAVELYDALRDDPQLDAVGLGALQLEVRH